MLVSGAAALSSEPELSSPFSLLFEDDVLPQRLKAATKRSSRNSVCSGANGRLEPIESLDVAAVDQMRVLDLEARGQAVDQQHAAGGLVAFELQHGNQTLVLLELRGAAVGARKINLLAIERVEGARDREALVDDGGLRRQRSADDR